MNKLRMLYEQRTSSNWKPVLRASLRHGVVPVLVEPGHDGSASDLRRQLPQVVHGERALEALPGQLGEPGEGDGGREGGRVRRARVVPEPLRVGAEVGGRRVHEEVQQQARQHEQGREVERHDGEERRRVLE